MDKPISKMSDALRWLSDHDPQDGHGQIGHTGSDQLFIRQIVLDAFEAGAKFAFSRLAKDLREGLAAEVAGNG